MRKVFLMQIFGLFCLPSIVGMEEEISTELNHTQKLHDAIHKGDLTAVKDAIAAGADVNRIIRVHTALTAAIMKERIDIIKYLLEIGADVNQESGLGTPLKVVLFWKPNNTEIIKLLKERIPIRRLHNAIKDSNITVVKSAIAAGADVNRVIGAHTALTLSIVIGNISIVEYLLEVGADVARPSNVGTPLKVAINMYNTEIIQLLLDKGGAGIVTEEIKKILKNNPYFSDIISDYLKQLD